MYTIKELKAQGVPESRLAVRRLRKQKRLTHARLAELAGVSEYVVHSFEIGAAWAEKYGTALQSALSAANTQAYSKAMREWREAHGLTVAEAAALLGSFHSVWMNGERGYKYLPKQPLRSRLDALLATHPEKKVA